MSHHVHVRLPCGWRLAADYRDPIVKVMRRYHRDLADHKWPPRKADVDALVEWFETSSLQSKLCYHHECDH